MANAQAEINQLMKSSAYRDVWDPQHEETVQHVQRLFQRVHGKRPISKGGVR